MSVIQYISSGGMASIGGDLPEPERKKLNELIKQFGDEVRAYGIKLQVPASLIRVMQATYLFAGRDAIQYHFCFVDAPGSNTLIYRDLAPHGVIPLQGILHQLRIEIGDPLWGLSVPIRLDGEARSEYLKNMGKQYVDTILQSQQNPTKRPSEESIVVPEIASGIERFRKDYPVGTRTAFIIMSFQKTKLHDVIVSTIKESLKKHGIIALRADDKEYMDDLFPNIRTYMHACDFGVVVLERIIQEDFNPNVSLEAGYMMGLGKNVLLLKDSTLKSLQTDLVGKLYKPFDLQAVAESMPAQIEKWLKDKGQI
jgi:hypothetical protein